MQMNQYVGLNKWAQQKVLAKRTAVETGERTYEDGSKEPFQRSVDVPMARISVIGQIEGLFDEVVASLRRFELPEGEIFEEFVQASPCYGGPMFYTALKDSNGVIVPESLWGTDVGIAEALTDEQPYCPDWPTGDDFIWRSSSMPTRHSPAMSKAG